MNLDYLAGHFDGEGSIFSRRKYKTGNLSIVISVGNTYLPVLNAYQKTFGGHIQFCSPGKGRIGNKPFYQWTLTDWNSVAKFLMLMESRLHEKRPKALEALAICTNRFLGRESIS